MLRILIVTLFLLFCALKYSPHSQSAPTVDPVKRLTNTPAHTLNLNPSLTDDGRTLVFESSSAEFGDGGGEPSFHAIRADVLDGTFMEIARGRMVSPALSRDGRVVAFASNEDLVGENPDRNSEIFVFDGPELRQLTHTENKKNFQPSISSDGQVIVFTSDGETPKISGDGTRIYVKRNTDLFVIDRETRVETLIRSGFRICL